jgi:opacity protein-like surface antigen
VQSYFLKKLALRSIIALPVPRRFNSLLRLWVETKAGENFGDMTINGELAFLEAHGPQAHIHCFEPVPAVHVRGQTRTSGSSSEFPRRGIVMSHRQKNAAAGVLFAALLGAPSGARAQDSSAGESSARAVEVTPYVSLNSAASTGVGAAVRWPIGANFSVELEASQRYAEINALASSVNLVFDFPALGRVTPYAVGGLGLEQYGFATGMPGAVIARRATAFTVNAGGGVRVPVDDKWGVRSDVRWSNGIGRDAPERWRLYNGVTFAGGAK